MKSFIKWIQNHVVVLVLIYLILSVSSLIGLSFLLTKKFGFDNDICISIITGSFILLGIPLTAMFTAFELKKQRQKDRSDAFYIATTEITLKELRDVLEKNAKNSKALSGQPAEVHNSVYDSFIKYNTEVTKYLVFLESVKSAHKPVFKFAKMDKEKNIEYVESMNDW